MAFTYLLIDFYFVKLTLTWIVIGKVARVLPYWLANPDVAELDLLSEEVPVDNMEVRIRIL